MILPTQLKKGRQLVGKSLLLSSVSLVSKLIYGLKGTPSPHAVKRLYYTTWQKGLLYKHGGVNFFVYLPCLPLLNKNHPFMKTFTPFNKFPAKIAHR